MFSDEFFQKVYEGSKEKGDAKTVYKGDKNIGYFVNESSEGAEECSYIIQKPHQQDTGCKNRKAVYRYLHVLFIQLIFSQGNSPLLSTPYGTILTYCPLFYYSLITFFLNKS